jgi:putative transposase
MVLDKPGRIVRQVWKRLPEYFSIQLDEMIIMPNHLHGIIWILESDIAKEDLAINGISSKTHHKNLLPPKHPTGTQPGSLGAIAQNFQSIRARKINHSKD